MYRNLIKLGYIIQSDDTVSSIGDSLWLETSISENGPIGFIHKVPNFRIGPDNIKICDMFYAIEDNVDFSSAPTIVCYVD